jgi:hypothetical protein
VASAAKFLLKGLFSGDLGEISPRSKKAMETMLGQAGTERGIGWDVILDFLNGIPGVNVGSLSPNLDREGIIVMRAYLDASGKKTDAVVVVAGFMGWVSNFERFEQMWAAFLEEYELDHFHATGFWSKMERPYSSWNDAKWLKAKGDICKILSHAGGPPFGMSVALNLEAFKEWRGNLNHFYPADPYYFCLDRILYTMLYSTGPQPDSMTIYCDQEKEHELLGTEIARWHEERLNKHPYLATNPLKEPRPVSVHYGPKRQFVPLQLADILANDTFRRCCDYLRNGLMDDPYFSSCLKQSDKERLLTYFYQNVEMLNYDYDERFRIPPPNT